jgi:hypothetical protein
VGDNADWTSPFSDLAPAQRDKIEEMIDATYGDFMGVVAKGRRMGLEAVRALAKGRVYTGQQALEVGGCLDEAAYTSTCSGIQFSKCTSVFQQCISSSQPPSFLHQAGMVE